MRRSVCAAVQVAAAVAAPVVVAAAVALTVAQGDGRPVRLVVWNDIMSRDDGISIDCDVFST